MHNDNVEGGGNGCNGVVISGEAVGADPAIGVKGERLNTAAVDAVLFGLCNRLRQRSFSEVTAADMLFTLEPPDDEAAAVAIGVNLGAPGREGNVKPLPFVLFTGKNQIMGTSPKTCLKFS